MYVDLSSGLSYNRRNEPKLVLMMLLKADTKNILKGFSDTPCTSIPEVQPQTESHQAAKS